MIFGEIQIFDEITEIEIDEGSFPCSTTENLDNLQSLFSIIDNPFGYSGEDYYIGFNEKIELWYCRRSSITTDGVTANIYGYSNTPSKALEDCNQNLKKIASVLKEQGRI